ncbi:NTP pyrophosphohydrolase [Spongisporangium articulatum]|uniref:NTP pyrophosphohydrolase n=1 Tax=Spongisporangium articulatum TaxID=3362603 RepID=A0ABW8AJC7_9ACTN
MGSVPDGWWRDRRGAAERLIARLPSLPYAVVAVVEGQARSAAGVEGVTVRAAAGSGDDEIVRVAEEWAPGADVVVVTADRGLRARLPSGVVAEGPRWLLDQLTP